MSQRASQARDSASIDAAHDRGSTAVTTFWMKLTRNLAPAGAGYGLPSFARPCGAS
jgi:hypothetical protein